MTQNGERWSSGAGASSQTVVGDTVEDVQSHPAATVGDGQATTGDNTTATQHRHVTFRERVRGWSGLKQVGVAIAGLASVGGLGLAIWQLIQSWMEAAP